MKVLLFGADTSLGQAIAETWTEFDLVGLDQQAVDITHPLDISRAILLYRPNVVVNCAEKGDWTWCQDHLDEANLFNGTAVGYIAKACEAQRLTFIQVSTILAEGQTPLHPYAQSKLHGEQQAVAGCHRLYVVRAPLVGSDAGDATIRASALYIKTLLLNRQPYGTYRVTTNSTE